MMWMGIFISSVTIEYRVWSYKYTGCGGIWMEVKRGANCALLVNQTLTSKGYQVPQLIYKCVETFKYNVGTQNIHTHILLRPNI